MQVDFGSLTDSANVILRVHSNGHGGFIMSEFKVNTITNRDGSYGPQVCGITTFGSSGMTLPSGPTEFRGGRGIRGGLFAWW